MAEEKTVQSLNGNTITDVLFSGEHQTLFSEEFSTVPAGKMYGTDVIRVIPYTMNFDVECRNDFTNGKGIRIQSYESFDRKNKKIWDGLQSPFFGSDYGDELAFAERFTCACGKLRGQMHEHDFCPDCNTEVEYSDVDLTKYGWIILEGNMHVITPLYYAKLEKTLGKVDASESVIHAIINVHYKDDTGNSVINNPDTPCLDDKDKITVTKHPFIRKGMRWLYDNIREVLDYYFKRKKPKAKEFNELYDNIDKIFCSCIPVYSAVMRMEAPGEKGEKVYKVKTNTCYRSIIRSSNKINDKIREADGDPITSEDLTAIDKFLASIQNELSDLFEEEFRILAGSKAGKDGFIQSKVIAGRYNYSARNIIIAGNRVLHCDEMEMCYGTFLELFRFEIIDIYAKFKDITRAEANMAVRRAATRFDKDLYYIMQMLIKDRSNLPFISLIVNRNPSINFCSFVKLKVAAIKPSVGDRTLTINRRVLITMAADFDGDQVNIFRVFGAELGNLFEKNMNPKLNLFISKANGRLNTAVMPAKDEAIGFWLFNNVERRDVSGSNTQSGVRATNS